MVAKSYQSLEIIGDVFSSSGRNYVNVKLKSGKIKTVRWYSDSEYRKMYPDEPVAATPSRSVKEALGFANGYITIFKGDTYAEIDWFHASIARYAKWWGWYIISTDEVPTDIPASLTPVRLSWDAVGNDNGELKSESIIKEAVEALIYDTTSSEYVGEIGERLELTLTIEKAISLDGEHPSTMHIMRDECGNCFVWTTAAKSWTAGGTHRLRGTVKDHRTYKGEKQTVLNRCISVSK